MFPYKGTQIGRAATYQVKMGEMSWGTVRTERHQELKCNGAWEEEEAGDRAGLGKSNLWGYKLYGYMVGLGT